MEKAKRNEVKERIYSALSSTGSTWLTTAETTKICEDFALSEKDFIEDSEFAYYKSKNGTKKMVTLRTVADAESAIATNFIELLVNHRPKQTSITLIRELVSKFEAEENGGHKLHCHQVDAVIMVVNNSLSILTGGPGTGKTTVLRAIAYVLRQLTEGITISYIAPTGKAAKRITESTGEYACTGHKKIGLGCSGRLRDITERVLFSDESSMDDIWLASALSKCIYGDRRFVFVGDVDQLPSVGLGAVLRDIIRCGVIPKTMLTHTFRQDNSTMLYGNICNVREGKAELIEGEDFHPNLLPEGDVADGCIKAILEAYMKSIQKYGIEQTIVLLPYRRNGVCSNRLNNEIQKIVNPGGKGCRHTDKDGNSRVFRVNDPVMQLENNEECVNGEVGTVIRVSEQYVTVEYTDTTVTYGYDALDELTLAYAMSIHKSQGSEYKHVIMALLNSHSAMLQRNLFYTGITRAKVECTVFYQQKALAKAVRTIAEDKRTTLLSEKMINLYSKYMLRRIA